MQAVHDALHDDHGPVHDQAEVDGPQAHQVGRDAQYVHHGHGKEHGQGNDGGHDQAGPPVAQQQYQNEDHDQPALDEVLLYRTDGRAHEFVAHQVGLDAYALGQGGLNLDHPLPHPFGDRGGVGPPQHHDPAAHGLLPVADQGAVAGGRAVTYLGHVLDQDRHACAHVDHQLTDVLQVLQDAVGADVVDQGVLFDVGPAGILVVVLQHREQVGNGHAHGLEQVGVYGHLVLLEVAAHGVDLHHPLDAGKLAADDPVLNGAQLHGAVAVFVALLGHHHVLVNFPQPGGDGGHLGGTEFAGNGVFGLTQVLADELAGKVDVHVFREDHGHYREAEEGDGADLDDVLQVLQGQLDGRGDEALHLLGGQGGRGGDDLYLIVGDVGYGIDGKLAQGIDAPGNEAQDEQPYDQLIPHGISDKLVEHEK